MTPATYKTSDNPRKEIGSAVWLLMLLLRFVPAEWTGDEPAWIAGGNPVCDAELAERLEVSPAVITKWRLRLRKIGLLGWLVSPGKGRAFSKALRVCRATTEVAPRIRRAIRI